MEPTIEVTASRSGPPPVIPPGVHRLPQAGLPAIPVIDCGPRYALELIEKAGPTVHRLLDMAGHGMPRAALRAADRVSRAWLARNGSPYLAEIDTIGRTLGRPGAHFFNVHYEWGCTTGAFASPDRSSARLVRVLDWRTRGLGRNIVCARIAGPAGPWLSLTWPGYTGALQAMAPGRFAAAINQAPMLLRTGAFYLDWAANRARVWRQPHPTPAHLLRRVFEEAPDFAAARRLLILTPVCAPAIFTLAGVRPDDACVIERREESAAVIDGTAAAPACAANEWQATRQLRVRGRGQANGERRTRLAALTPELDGRFDWLEAPLRNADTRLALIADAASGRLQAQGWEQDGPATAVLEVA